MSDELRTVSKTLSVIKTPPSVLSKTLDDGTPDDDGVWVWATREIVDSVGDIVRVDGVDFGDYHNPPETKLKILASHLMTLPDGKLPVVATVEQVVKTLTSYNGSAVMGIAIYCKWLRDPKTGELLELAAHYKQMVDAGGVDSVSVGIIVKEFLSLAETGGMDITESTIYETSFVPIPMNKAANVIKHLIDPAKVEAYEHATKQVVPCEIDGTCEIKAERCCTRAKAKPVDDYVRHLPDGTKLVTLEAHNRIVDRVLDAVKSDANPDDLAKRIEGALSKELAPMIEVIRSLTHSVKQFADRLDTLESAIVVLTQPAAPGEADTQDAGAPDLSELSKKLDDLKRFVSK